MKPWKFKLLALLYISISSATCLGITMNARIEGRVKVLYTISSPVSLLEPIIVEFTVENGLSEPIKFDLGLNRKSKFVFTVTRPDGSIVHVPPLSEEGSGVMGRISLQPKQTYTKRLLMNERYGFDQPGNYGVEIRLADFIQTESGRRINVSTKGNLRLQVEPRNPESLAKKCEELVKKTLGASSFEEAADFAFALSYVNDPIAVPYLKRVLESDRMVESVAINGLVRIGNREAVEVLISTLKSKVADTALRARYALSKIEKSTQDSSIKEAIRRVL